MNIQDVQVGQTYDFTFRGTVLSCTAPHDNIQVRINQRDQFTFYTGSVSAVEPVLQWPTGRNAVVEYQIIGSVITVQTAGFDGQMWKPLVSDSRVDFVDCKFTDPGPFRKLTRIIFAGE